MTQECHLFRYRFQQLGPKEIDAFMQQYNLSFAQISVEEREEFDQPLRQNFAANRFRRADGSLGQQGAFDNNFFKIPFEQAVNMMQSRNVFLKGGFAFVPRDKLMTLIQRPVASPLLLWGQPCAAAGSGAGRGARGEGRGARGGR